MTYTEKTYSYPQGNYIIGSQGYFQNRQAGHANMQRSYPL